MAIAALLDTARLVTLIGPGGVGKTRLAVAMMAATADFFPDGVTLVSLTPLADPLLVLPAVARALGVREVGGTALCDTLHAALRARRTLLVLDNCEHLLEAAPEVAALLAACPQLTILATSRAPLHLGGEHIYPVAPLALPSLGRVPTANEVAATPAAQLFVARERAVAPGFALTDANAAAVAAICRRLDGLPLALELGAAWIRLLPPTALLARLDPALPLLEGGARDLPARQRTLRATIAWSHDLLDARARLLLRRLAVFAGGCTLAAAEAVCADGEHVGDVLAGLGALVDWSLVRRDEGAGDGHRFTMPETIREYALGRLVAGGEADLARRRHAAYFHALVEMAIAASPSTEEAWFRRWDDERDNLRAALDWAIAQGEAAMALRLGGELAWFWNSRGQPSECLRWLEAALALPATPGGVPAAIRARALGGAGLLAAALGNAARAQVLFEESLALWREVGAEWWVAGTRHDPEMMVAGTLHNLGFLAREQGDDARAIARLEESLAITRASEERDNRLVPLSLIELGTIALHQGDHERALAAAEEGLAWSRRAGFARGAAGALDVLGHVALERGDLSRAQARFAERLRLARDLGHRLWQARSLEGLGAVAAARRQGTRAARLFAAATAAREALQPSRPEPSPGALEARRNAARVRLDPQAWEAAWAEGQALSAEGASALALERPGALERSAEPATATSHGVTPPYPAGLTPREVEVLRLYAASLSHREIAARLAIAPRTVGTHVSNIFGKTGIASRLAAARYAAAHGLA